MQQQSFRRFVRIAVAASILLLAAAGWSQLRLKAARAEIDALVSETLELVSRNEQLREQVETQTAVRQRLRSGGRAVRLEGAGVGSARATVHLDDDGTRALLVVERLLVDSSCAYQLRIVPSASPHLLVTFGVDPDGNVELLLDDLPAGIEEFRIERAATAETLLSGRS